MTRLRVALAKGRLYDRRSSASAGPAPPSRPTRAGGC